MQKLLVLVLVLFTAIPPHSFAAILSDDGYSAVAKIYADQELARNLAVEAGRTNPRLMPEARAFLANHVDRFPPLSLEGTTFIFKGEQTVRLKLIDSSDLETRVLLNDKSEFVFRNNESVVQNAERLSTLLKPEVSWNDLLIAPAHAAPMTLVYAIVALILVILFYIHTGHRDIRSGDMQDLALIEKRCDDLKDGGAATEELRSLGNLKDLTFSYSSVSGIKTRLCGEGLQSKEFCQRLSRAMTCLREQAQVSERMINKSGTKVKLYYDPAKDILWANEHAIDIR